MGLDLCWNAKSGRCHRDYQIGFGISSQRRDKYGSFLCPSSTFGLWCGKYSSYHGSLVNNIRLWVAYTVTLTLLYHLCGTRFQNLRVALGAILVGKKCNAYIQSDLFRSNILVLFIFHLLGGRCFQCDKLRSFDRVWSWRWIVWFKANKDVLSDRGELQMESQGLSCLCVPSGLVLGPSHSIHPVSLCLVGTTASRHTGMKNANITHNIPVIELTSPEIDPPFVPILDGRYLCH